MSALAELRHIVEATGEDESFCSRLLHEIDQMLEDERRFHELVLKRAREWDEFEKRHSESLSRLITGNG